MNMDDGCLWFVNWILVGWYGVWDDDGMVWYDDGMVWYDDGRMV